MKTLLTLTLFLSISLAFAQAEKDIASQVENLRLALIDPTVSNLSELSSIHLSYGHSSGNWKTKHSLLKHL